MLIIMYVNDTNRIMVWTYITNTYVGTFKMNDNFYFKYAKNKAKTLGTISEIRNIHQNTAQN